MKGRALDRDPRPNVAEIAWHRAIQAAIPHVGLLDHDRTRCETCMRARRLSIAMRDR
jgi:hypothetical protein